MKFTAAFFFLALYLIALLKPVQPLIDYWLRFDYYKNELCFNRARPEMNCNGQCILMQRLKQAAQEQQSPQSSPGSQRVNLEDYPVGIVEDHDILKIAYTLIRTVFTERAIFKTSAFSSEIFHPPATTC